MKAKLKIHGSTLGRTTPVTTKAVSFLDKAKEHECYTIIELSTHIGVNDHHLRQKASHFLLPYRFKTRGTAWLYASPKTVKNFKEGMYDE